MRFLRIIVLFPFSVLYGLIIRFRHLLFDTGLIKSTDFDFPLICVGNLAAGGTGKTPMTEYLLRLLFSEGIAAAVLSRGYGRKTRGFRYVSAEDTAVTAGDEPCQYAYKFPEARIAVGEDRTAAVRKMLMHPDPPSAIILDDAFQHRKIRAGMNILLTTWNNLYSDDFLIPAGGLRDVRSASGRAEVVVVSKCPDYPDEEQIQQIRKKLRLRSSCRLFFSTLIYGNPGPVMLPGNGGEKALLNPASKALVVTGIADSRPFLQYLSQRYKVVAHMKFSDHHNYNSADIRQIKENFIKFADGETFIVTTEKDAARLKSAEAARELAGLAVVSIPVELKFNENDRKLFEQIILNYVRKNQTNS